MMVDLVNQGQITIGKLTLAIILDAGETIREAVKTIDVKIPIPLAVETVIIEGVKVQIITKGGDMVEDITRTVGNEVRVHRMVQCHLEIQNILKIHIERRVQAEAKAKC